MKITLHATTQNETCTWELNQLPLTLDIPTTPDETKVEVTGEEESVMTTLTSTGPWQNDVALRATIALNLSGGVNATYWPLYQGTFERRGDTTSDDVYEFRGPGWNSVPNDGSRVGIPAVVVQDTDGYLLVGTDPGYSAHISIDSAAGTASIEWAYLAAAGAHRGITRRIVSARAATFDEALEAWFTLATPDIPAGPAWLHEIDWTHYDFMSKNGAGWFDDIDAVCEMVAPEDRHHVAFTLHGWYDLVGRYCFDSDTRTLDRNWTVFPFMKDERLLEREGAAEVVRTGLGITFRNLKDYEPIPMNWNEVRRRISYAKDRGLRVPFYLITGLWALHLTGVASGNEEAGSWSRLSRLGGWLAGVVLVRRRLPRLLGVAAVA